MPQNVSVYSFVCLEHFDSEGRHFAQISHASIEGFEAHFDVVAITTDDATIMSSWGCY